MTNRTTLHSLIRMATNTPKLAISHGINWGTMDLLGLVPPLLARAFIDRLQVDGDVSWLLVLGLAGIALAQSVLWMGAGWVEILYRFNASALLRRNIVGSILRQPGAVPLPFSLGETIGRFRDDAAIAEDSLDWTDEIAVQLLIATVAFGMLLTVDATIALTVILPLVLVVFVAQRASGRLARYRELASESTSQVTGMIGDMMTAVETIRAAGAERHVMAHLRMLNANRSRASIIDRVTTRAAQAVTSNLMGFGTGAIMLIAADRIRGGSLSVGDYLLFLSYMGFITGTAGGFGLYLAQFRQTGVAFERMTRLMQAGRGPDLVAHTPTSLRGPLPRLDTDSTATNPLEDLVVTDLASTLPGSDRGIGPVCFSITAGERVVITGRIGSGKTTLLRTLLGLLPIDSGSIRWNGQLIVDPAGWMTPPHVAYTPQVPRLFSASIRDNILLGTTVPNPRVDRAVSDATLEPDLTTLASGLDTMVGSRGVNLSGGQVQRTAVARMLVREATLLVIDDVSSAPDVRTEAALWDHLTCRNATIIAVSHRPVALRAADRILVMKDGELHASGRLDELLATNAGFRDLWSHDITNQEEDTR